MSASPSLGLVLALAAALFIGALLGQRVPPRRLVWWGVVGVCWLFSVAMLWVTFSMSVMLWSSTAMASAAPAPTAAAAPAASSASAAGGDAGSSAIANAMTAIGVTVAVVTLILSLGTSWFGQQMERVAKLEKKLKALRDGQLAFAGVVTELNAAAGRAEQALATLRASGHETDLLHDRIIKARAVKQELEVLIARAPARPADSRATPMLYRP